jgi:hypothetical protein
MLTSKYSMARNGDRHLLLEQRLFERYQHTLQNVLRDARPSADAFAAWDAWLSVAFSNPRDRALIPDPRLLGSRRGAA